MSELERREIPCADPSYVDELLGQPQHRRLLALLRLLCDKKDSLAWATLLQLQPGIGRATFEYLYNQARGEMQRFSSSLLQAHDNDYPGAPQGSPTRLRQLVDETNRWIASHEEPPESPERWSKWIFERVVEEDVLPAPTREFEDLLASVDTSVEEDCQLDRYLSQIRPVGRDIAQAQSTGVRIMTMIMSKGLTARATIIGALEDGVVPRTNADLSEERRILYVGMSRAKEFLFATWARRRRGPTAHSGRATMALRRPSHFLEGGPVEPQDGDEYLGDRGWN